MFILKLLKELIRLHRFLFYMAMFLTLLSVGFNLYWNSFLADTIDLLGNKILSGVRSEKALLLKPLAMAAVIILIHTAVEYLSSCLASYTCELFAHEMRMGYGRFYLQSDIRILSRLNAGEEQSAVQNELAEVSAYLNENLFSFAKQFVSFAVTAVFLLCLNFRLALLSVLPAVPLMIYCYCSGKVIKGFTEQCQKSRRQLNGLTDTLLELFPIIQVYNAGRLMDTAVDNRLQQWERANVRKERAAARLMSLSGLLSFIPLLMLMGFGGAMVINGEISIGSFYIFINLSGNVSGFLQNMPGIYAAFRRFQASVGRIEKKLAGNISKGKSHVSLRDFCG